MKTTVKKIVKQEYELFESVTCELCKRVFKSENWDVGNYSINKTTVSVESGHRWGDGGHSEEIEYDICPECFDTVLIPFLESKGAHPRKTEADW